jgi:hypothetical protein
VQYPQSIKVIEGYYGCNHKVYARIVRVKRYGSKNDTTKKILYYKPIRVDKWKYYNSQGLIIKQEFYKKGKLKSIE